MKTKTVTEKPKFASAYLFRWACRLYRKECEAKGRVYEQPSWVATVVNYEDNTMSLASMKGPLATVRRNKTNEWWIVDFIEAQQ